tara:strand:+ start:4068 stop:4289 length:222 start_codon:yes stop_codon:yes gene_type:complete
VCRKIFDGENFKVQVTVHNTLNETSNTVEVGDQYLFDVLDVFFDVENLVDMESLLRDFGVSMSDLDPSVLNTE